MPQYLLMCKSLTYAQRAAQTLDRMGITAIITKAPKGATGLGCGYSVKVSERHLTRSITILKEAGLGPTKVFLLTQDGSLSEVNG